MPGSPNTGTSEDSTFAAFIDLGRIKSPLTCLIAEDRPKQENVKKAVRLSNECLAMFDRGDLKSAEKRADELLELEPDLAMGWLLRATIHNDIGNHQQAIADCDE